MITFESIFSKRNIEKAFKYLSIKKNGGGTDKSPVDELRNYWSLNSERILEEIKSFTFAPEIIKEYEIINGRGKRRKVTEYSYQDKFITRLISQKLNDFFNPLFMEYSYAYRENKGTQTAAEQVKEYIEDKNETVVEIDIKNYFDEISIERLLDILKQHIVDKRVIYLLDRYLFCTISVDDEFYSKIRGIVQGCSMSPCLSNIYLHGLDVYLYEHGYKYIRFADNICIYTKTNDEGVAIYNEVKDILVKEYDLPINEAKSGVYGVYDRRLLGYDFYKRGNKVKIEKHVYQEKAYYRSWHECAIEKVNREYHITRSGVLNKKDYALLFENDNEKHHIPVEATEQLDIYNEIVLTSAVINTISYNKIRLGLYDKHGDLLGYYVPESYNQDSKTVIAQSLEYADDKKHLQMAKAMEIAAIHNIRSNIRYYKKRKNDERLGTIEQFLTDGITRLNQCQSIDNLLLEEARCRQMYYSGFNYILNSEYFMFEKRSKRPPLDSINAMISFGNTLLYNRIQQIIWKTSLDSRIGIFHAANRRHHSLNLDFADLFKAVTVDRVIFALINRKQINEKHFVKNKDGSIYLSDEGKKLFIENFLEKMSDNIEYEGKRITYNQLIEHEIRKYLNHILNGVKYKPYKYY